MALVALVFALVGGGVLVTMSHAATPTASVQAESGTIASPAAAVNDASASQGSAVKFNASQSTSTTVHYTGNGNFGAGGTYLPGAYGFDIADISSVSEANSLPTGVRGLVWIGLCNGADSAFQAAITPFIGNSKVYGFFLMDEPDPPNCPQANLKAESDWVHAHDPTHKTYMVLDVQTASSNPSYMNTYNPANSDIDLFGLDPYPCRTELSGCNFTYVTKAVTAAQAAGVPLANIVPVFQAFGGGGYIDDGGGQYLFPTAAQETQLLATWDSVVPNPVMDSVYSWGSQNSDTALESSPTLQQIFAQHNQ
jgi:hypothetical protein